MRRQAVEDCHEPVREAAEYLEYVATALVVVFAAWAINLIQFVRYH